MRAKRADPEFKIKERKLRDQNWLDVITWPKIAIYSIRSRAKKNNMEFSITSEDIIVPDVCPVLGIPLQPSLGVGARTKPNSPSVDRIDNTKGYSKDNIKVISMRANVLKSNGSIEEFEAIVKYMKENSI